MNDGKANPYAICVRIKSKSAKDAVNQRAHDLRVGRQPKYVDQSRSDQNRHLRVALTASQLRKICDERRRDADLKRKRALSSNVAVATVGIITFGSEAQKFVGELTEQKQDEMIQAVAEEIAKKLQTSLSGISIHLDESAFHAHFQMPATRLDGTPVSKSATKAVLNQIQDIAAEVAQRYDQRIQRGFRRVERERAGASRAETINRQVRELHDDLPRELQAAKAKLGEQQDRFKKNQERLLAANEKAARLAEDNEEKAAKALKTAVAYERRAEDAGLKIEEFEKQVARLEKLTAEAVNAETRRDHAIQAAEEAEARLNPLRDAVDAVDRHEAAIEEQVLDEIRFEQEAVAAKILFDEDKAEATALAVLHSGDESGFDYDHFGGFDLTEFFKFHRIKSVSDRLDLRRITSSICSFDSNAHIQIVRAVVADKNFSEAFFALTESISTVARSLRGSAGRWHEQHWNVVSERVADVLKQSLERLTDVLVGEEVSRRKRNDRPTAANPLSEMSEDAQAAVRRAIGTTGPSR